MDFTVNMLASIMNEAQTEAYKAADQFFKEKLGGVDQYACGFAWVNIYVKGNTKLGRAMKAAGYKRNDYEKCFQIWNPSRYGCQNVDTLEAGARAAAQVFKKYGIDAYAGSRLD